MQYWEAQAKRQREKIMKKCAFLSMDCLENNKDTHSNLI